jgi:hypothetical protein
MHFLSISSSSMVWKYCIGHSICGATRLWVISICISVGHDSMVVFSVMHLGHSTCCTTNKFFDESKCVFGPFS